MPQVAAKRVLQGIASGAIPYLRLFPFPENEGHSVTVLGIVFFLPILIFFFFIDPIDWFRFVLCVVLASVAPYLPPRAPKSALAR